MFFTGLFISKKCLYRFFCLWNKFYFLLVCEHKAVSHFKNQGSTSLHLDFMRNCSPLESEEGKKMNEKNIGSPALGEMAAIIFGTYFVGEIIIYLFDLLLNFIGIIF